MNRIFDYLDTLMLMLADFYELKKKDLELKQKIAHGLDVALQQIQKND